ncbi:MAG: CDP-glycerol glycerophosphotransferase family protein [Bradymonadales bacterium]|nr:CDP-glycerol glycerophosphotransferase family protein [Bradymonadales bacterium]
MRLLLVNAFPLEHGGPAERTLDWLGDRLAETGADLHFCTTNQTDSLQHALAAADLICAAELRPGPDLVVAGALAAFGKPLVLIPHGYGFCHVGTRTCTDCPLADGCRQSDRVAIYRDLHAAASLILYLSPLHRQASEPFVGAYPERTMVLPPPRLPVLPTQTVGGAPEKSTAPAAGGLTPAGTTRDRSLGNHEGGEAGECGPGRPRQGEGRAIGPRKMAHIAFCNPNDPVEWLNLKAHAYRIGVSAEPHAPWLRVHGAPVNPGEVESIPGLLALPAVPQQARRLELLAASSAFACLPGRPLPFGAEALACLHANHPVHHNDRVGFASYPANLADRHTYQTVSADRWQEALERIGSAVSMPVPRALRPVPFSRPLLWAHRMGLGDSINLLPFARALSAMAPLTWVAPGRHLDLLEGQSPARLVADEEFDIEAAIEAFDLIVEISVGMRHPYERLYQGDILGRRWIRFDLARQANAYQSVHENLLSFLARCGSRAIPGIPSIQIDPLRREAALHRLEEAGIRPHDDLVISVHPGSGREFKCWPVERFGLLCRRLRQELGARLVVIGGVGEEPLVDQLLEQSGGADLVSLGDTLLDVAGLLSCATLHLGNDSGITHLASACDTPVVALFGPTAPATWGPAHPWRTIVVARDAHGVPQRSMTSISVKEVLEAVERSLRRIALERPLDARQTLVRLPTVTRTDDRGWRSAIARIDGQGDEAGRALDDLLERCTKPMPYADLVDRYGLVVDLVLAAGLLGPSWLARAGEGRILLPHQAAVEITPRDREPRCGYLVESGYQHAFPVLAMLPVLPGPVFSTGARMAARLSSLARVFEVEQREIARVLDEEGIEVLLTTSQRIKPDQLRGKYGRRVVFIGHGESDKTHGQGGSPRPSFVHHRVNDAFDLIAVASHFHMARYRNPDRVLVGYLKHDLFVAGNYAVGRPNPGCILWAPGWGRHSAVDPWLSQVVETTGRMGLECIIHLHPFSFEAEPRLVQRVQLEVVKNRHVKMAHCANILDAMAPCQLLLTDVSSVAYDWLLFDRPLVFLDHEGLVIEEEKRLFPAGIALRPGEDLDQALRQALAHPTVLAEKRRHALEQHYYQLDGKAACRLRDEILRRWRETWCLPNL